MHDNAAGLRTQDKADFARSKMGGRRESNARRWDIVGHFGTSGGIEGGKDGLEENCESRNMALNGAFHTARARCAFVRGFLLETAFSVQKRGKILFFAVSRAALF